MPDAMIAYCGPAAVPDDLWTRWNFDPLLIAMLAALALAVGRGRSVRHPSGLGGDRADARHLRLAALRAVVGAVLGAGAAPCAVGRRRGAAPGAGLSATARGLTAALRAGRGTCDHPLALACAGALCVGPRQRACLLADAGIAARQRLAPVAGNFGVTAQPGPALVALVATIGQMGLLGALIVFAPRPLYAVHFASTAALGTDSARRPAVAGLLMWVPAMLPYLGRGTLVGLVEPAAERASRCDNLAQIRPPWPRSRIWSGGLIVAALSVLAAPDARGGTGA